MKNLKIMNKYTINNSHLSKLMLITQLICNLIYSATYPYIYSQAIRQISDNYISMDNIVNCISVVVFSKVWLTYGDKLIKHFDKLCVVESIADVCYMAYTIHTHNLKIYYVSSSLVMALLSRQIICGYIKLKAKVHPNENEREAYDNRSNIVCALGTLIGSIIAIVIKLDLNTLLVIACIGNLFDNVSGGYIWHLLQLKNSKC